MQGADCLKWSATVKKKYTLFFIPVGIILLLDQVTKIYVMSHMSLRDSIIVIDGFFNITYIRNPGAAFGFLADSSPAFRSIFFVAIAVMAIIMILYLIKKISDERLLLTLCLSLILGGAVGNLIDRVRFGEVIDFLDFYLFSYHWPAFNVADSAITVGAIILVLEMVKKKTKTDETI
ncbi:MAG: lipoprotein signal peptidase [Deltaproteobacteria bacterium]|nr:lipoprotein signal peptidase [Deltaproteobacteria bacterium]